MNAEKFTQKSMEALRLAQTTAAENGNNSVEEEHLLFALVSQDEGLVGEIFKSLGASSENIKSALDAAISKFPKISGGGYDPSRIYISGSLDKALSAAEKQAEKMKDDYISVEHLLLGIMEHPTENIKKILNSQNITDTKVLDSLKKIRGNQKVQSDNPEDTYNVLKKYGTEVYRKIKNSAISV